MGKVSFIGRIIHPLRTRRAIKDQFPRAFTAMESIAAGTIPAIAYSQEHLMHPTADGAVKTFLVGSGIGLALNVIDSIFIAGRNKFEKLIYPKTKRTKKMKSGSITLNIPKDLSAESNRKMRAETAEALKDKVQRLTIHKLENRSSEALEDAPQAIIERFQNKYTGIKKYAEGGMGVLYKAQEKDGAERKVIIKMPKFSPDMNDTDREKVIRRFQEREIKLIDEQLKGLEEIPEIYEKGRDFYVSEYVEGITIQELYRASGTGNPDGCKLPIPEILLVFFKVISAVKVLHMRKVMHRDLKMDNLMLIVGSDNNGNSIVKIKIIDFGTAKMEGDLSAITQTGEIQGNLDGMHPAAAEDEKVREVRNNPLQDIFGVTATVLYPLIFQRRARTIARPKGADGNEKVPWWRAEMITLNEKAQKEGYDKVKFIEGQRQIDGQSTKFNMLLKELLFRLTHVNHQEILSDFDQIASAILRLIKLYDIEKAGLFTPGQFSHADNESQSTSPDSPEAKGVAGSEQRKKKPTEGDLPKHKGANNGVEAGIPDAAYPPDQNIPTEQGIIDMSPEARETLITLLKAKNFNGIISEFNTGGVDDQSWLRGEGIAKLILLLNDLFAQNIKDLSLQESHQMSRELITYLRKNYINNKNQLGLEKEQLYLHALEIKRIGDELKEHSYPPIKPPDAVEDPSGGFEETTLAVQTPPPVVKKPMLREDGSDSGVSSIPSLREDDLDSDITAFGGTDQERVRMRTLILNGNNDDLIAMFNQKRGEDNDWVRNVGMKYVIWITSELLLGRIDEIRDDMEESTSIARELIIKISSIVPEVNDRDIHYKMVEYLRAIGLGNESDFEAQTFHPKAEPPPLPKRNKTPRSERPTDPANPKVMPRKVKKTTDRLPAPPQTPEKEKAQGLMTVTVEELIIRLNQGKFSEANLWKALTEYQDEDGFAKLGKAERGLILKTLIQQVLEREDCNKALRKNVALALSSLTSAPKIAERAIAVLKELEEK